MNLFQWDERVIAGAKRRLKRLAILEDNCAVVPLREAEVENLLAGIELAGSARSGAETVDQPGDSFERSKFEYLHAAHVADQPGGGDFRTYHRAWSGFPWNPADTRTFSGSWHHVSIIGNLDPAFGAASIDGSCMIIGMGIDVEEVQRVQGAMERQGERFLKRIFTEKERAYCEQFKDKYERYAGRFAVKEAAMKALGTGWSRGVRWVDIEVLRLRGGRPTLELKGEARKIADRLGVKNIAISITHTSKQAMAQVIFES